MDFFTVDSLSMKTSDILSHYYNNLNKYQEELEKQNDPQHFTDPTDMQENKSFKPTYKRHKIFDPVKKKNILVPNKRLYDPRWLMKRTSVFHQGQEHRSADRNLSVTSSNYPENFQYRIVTVKTFSMHCYGLYYPVSCPSQLAVV